MNPEQKEFSFGEAKERKPEIVEVNVEKKTGCDYCGQEFDSKGGGCQYCANERRNLQMHKFREKKTSH